MFILSRQCRKYKDYTAIVVVLLQSKSQNEVHFIKSHLAVHFYATLNILNKLVNHKA